MGLEFHDQNGDEPRSTAFTHFVAAHVDWLNRFVQSRVPHRSVSEDVSAEVLGVAWRKLSHPSGCTLTQERVWLRRTAEYVVLRGKRDWRRRHDAYERVASEPALSAVDPADEVVAKDEECQRAEQDRRVRAAIALLKPEHRQLLELTAAGLKGPAIATKLGISHQRVRTQLMIARQEFARHWRESPASGSARRPA